MVAIATFAFAFALLGLAALFIHKHREVRAGRVLLSSLREKGDEQALALKDFLAVCRAEAHTWPPQLVQLGREMTHRAILAVAVFARSTERKAHTLADRLSHKHEFKRRESANEFLRQVGDFKNDEQRA
jgi:hypothetical protein